MKKLASLLLLAGVAAFGLVGCGDEGEVVGPQPEISVEVTPSSVTLSPGETATVSADVSTQGDVGSLSFEWASGNSSVATVSGNGATATITGQDGGTVNVTVTVTAANVDGAQTASTGVTVEQIEPEIRSLSVTPSEVTVEEGSSTTLTADFDATSSVEGLTLSFSSADTDVAEVTSTSDNDGDGVDEIATVQGNSSGTVAITVDASADNASSRSTSSSVEVVEQIQNEAAVSVEILAQQQPLSGTFNVNVQVDRGDETLEEVRLLVDDVVVGTETFTSSSQADDLAKQTGPTDIVFEVASAQFDALTGQNTFDDGEHTVRAEIDTQERGQNAATAERSATFDNQSGWVIYLQTQMPDTRNGDLISDQVLNDNGDAAAPGDFNPVTQGPNGFRWTTGHLTMIGVPVIYETGRSIRNTTFRFQDQNTNVIAASPALSTSEDVSGAIERLTGEDIDGAVNGFEFTFDANTAQTAGGTGVGSYTTGNPDFPDQAALRSVDNSGNTGPSARLAVFPAFFQNPNFIFSTGGGLNPDNTGINLDNEQATLSGAMAVNPPGRLQWINEDYPFSTNFTTPADPGGGPGGVNSNQSAFFAAEAGGTCPEGFGEVTTGQDVLDQGVGPSSTNDVYIACARWWDLFGNVATQGSDPFGVDPFDPTIAHQASGSALSGSSSGNTRFGTAAAFGSGSSAFAAGTAGAHGGQFVLFSFSDPGAVSSGFSPTPIRATVETKTGTGLGGSATSSCVFPSGPASACVKSLALSDPASSDSDVPPHPGLPSDDGYYSVDAFVRDNAANTSDNITLRWLIDTEDPVASGIDHDVPLVGGTAEEFLVDGADALDLIWATLEFNHGTHSIVMQPRTGDGTQDAIQDGGLGTIFDGETAFEESLMLGTTQISLVYQDFPRGIEVMDGSDAPGNSPTEFLDMTARVYDAAPLNASNDADCGPGGAAPVRPLWDNLTGNCDEQNETLRDAEIDDPTTDYTTGDFNTWAITDVSPAGGTVSRSGSGTISVTATNTYDENPGGDSFSTSHPWKNVNGGDVILYWRETAASGSHPWHPVTADNVSVSVVTTLGSPNRVEWTFTFDPDSRVPTQGIEFRVGGQDDAGNQAVTQTSGSSVTITQ